MCPRRVLFALAFYLGVGAMASGCGSDDGQPAAPTPSITTTAVPPQGESSTTTTQAATTTMVVRTIEVSLAGGQVVGGPRREPVDVGERVRILATSDVAEELHVHTYDRRVSLAPGDPGEIVFVADIPGRHEVEFEKSRRRALTLEVR